MGTCHFWPYFLVSHKSLSAAVVKLPNSYFVYAWNLLVSPQVLIGQTIYVDNTYAIEALYNKRLDKTTILLKQKGLVIKRQEFSGLKIIKLTTSNGVIGYEF